MSISSINTSSTNTSFSFLKKSLSTTMMVSMVGIAGMGLVGCSDDDGGTVIDGAIDEPVVETNYQKVEFIKAGTFVHDDNDGFDKSAAEIIAYHPKSKRSFVVNSSNGKVDVLDVSDVTNPSLVDSLDVSAIGGAVNSVAVHGDIVALAVQANVKTDNGFVVLYDANTLDVLSKVTVGALPDMVAFTEDGNYLLVANEGEPTDYTIDPEGSISVINIKDVNRPMVSEASFHAFDAQKEQLIQQGVRILGQKTDSTGKQTPSSVSEDLEPEYIAISKDNTTAYVSLQENNAIAIVDIATATVTDIKALGAKDHSIAGNELDVSDKDGKINITTWPIMGMYMPDAIATYQANGKNYLVTANEGDSREWGDFTDEVEIKDIKLDPSVFSSAACHGMDCGDKEALGRMAFSTSLGDANGDGIYDALYSFGARSFSIWDVSDMDTPVYDSGRFMATYTAEKYKDNFNASNDKNKFDNRSDNKGVEPEGVTIGQVGSQTIAFIGLERISSVMAFDVTDPKDVKFLGEINTRTFDDDKLDAAKEGTAAPNADGDLGPEGLTFISADDSPNGKPLLMVGYEVSGTSAIYELNFAE